MTAASSCAAAPRPASTRPSPSWRRAGARPGHRHPHRRHVARVAVQALWDHAVATFGRVDVWINNAGISAPRRPLPEVSEETVSAVVVGQPDRRHQRLRGRAGRACGAAGGWLDLEHGGLRLRWPEAAGHGDVRRHQARGHLPDRVAGQGDQGRQRQGRLPVAGHRRHRPADRRLRRSARGVREGPQDLQHPR